LLAAGNLVARFVSGHIADILQEGLLISGWVALWRPIEIFLYDWWPIRAEAALADRLSVMPVRISYKQDGSADAAGLAGRVASGSSGSERTNRKSTSGSTLGHSQTAG
jgi:hypothetical protein